MGLGLQGSSFFGTKRGCAASKPRFKQGFKHAQRRGLRPSSPFAHSRATPRRCEAAPEGHAAVGAWGSCCVARFTGALRKMRLPCRGVPCTRMLWNLLWRLQRAPSGDFHRNLVVGVIATRECTKCGEHRRICLGQADPAGQALLPDLFIGVDIYILLKGNMPVTL